MTRDEARSDVFDYIEMFYNPVRRHNSNGGLSPEHRGLLVKAKQSRLPLIATMIQ